MRLCEHVGHALRAAESERDQKSEAALVARERELKPIDPAKGMVLVTGGTGLLGRAVVSELRERGWAVRSVSRSLPSPSSREAGVQYRGRRPRRRSRAVAARRGSAWSCTARPKPRAAKMRTSETR